MSLARMIPAAFKARRDVRGELQLQPRQGLVGTVEALGMREVIATFCLRSTAWRKRPPSC